MFVITDAKEVWYIVKNSDDEEERRAAFEMLEMAQELEDSGLTPVFLFDNVDDKLYLTSRERIDRKLH